MNKNIAITIETLKAIEQKGVSFSNAIKLVVNKEKLSTFERNLVISLCGSVLRHMLVLDAALEEKIETKLPLELRYFYMIMIANRLFVKKMNEEEVIKEGKNYFKEFDLPFSYDLFKDLTIETLIPSKYPSTDLIHLSLRFNIPLGLLKRWKKHYGENLMYRIAKGIHQKERIFGLINHVNIHEEDFFNKYNRFEKTEISGLIKYSSDDKTIRYQATKNLHFIPLGVEEKELLDLIDINEFSSVAYFGEQYSRLLLGLANKLSNLLEADLISPLSSDQDSFKEDIQSFKLRKVSLLEADSKTICTCLSKPVDLFIDMPKSSNLAFLKNYPDHFLRCKPELLGEIIDNEKTSLKEAAPFIKVGGRLVYAIKTMNKSESHNLIKWFLENHTNFELEHEKQMLPFGKYDHAFYFAILKKVKEDD